MDCCPINTWCLFKDPIVKKYRTNNSSNTKRAGTIILDFTKKRVLLIQSYNKFWGLPKGHIEPNESLKQCAIRETLEETGIFLYEKDLIKVYDVYNGDGVYFIVNGSGLQYDISKIHNLHEITGISWFCIDCLNKNLKSNKIQINSHLRQLISVITKELFYR